MELMGKDTKKTPLLSQDHLEAQTTYDSPMLSAAVAANTQRHVNTGGDNADAPNGIAVDTSFDIEDGMLVDSNPHFK
jgi:hypothetical protein